MTCTLDLTTLTHSADSHHTTLGFLSVRPAPRARPATQPFIDDVNAFLKDKDPDTAIRQLQDTYSRLQMQEV